MSDTLADQVEQLIDKHGLYAVTEAIGDICHAKENHLASAWQDLVAAKCWRDAGKLYGTLEAKVHRLGI